MAAPKHVGIIMDGNRRYAKKNLLSMPSGHAKGRDQLKKVLEWSRQRELETLSVYALSTQNFNRPKRELEYLMNLFREALEELEIEAHKNQIRSRFMGRLHMLPEDIQEKMNKITSETQEYKKFTLNVCVAYGGRAEIIDAVKHIATKVKEGKIAPEEIDEQTINESIYVQEEPDMIIRTGGDHRTSNFLIWQSWYSEWFFIDSLWPEMTQEEFNSCLDEFEERERRFGR